MEYSHPGSEDGGHDWIPGCTCPNCIAGPWKPGTEPANIEPKESILAEADRIAGADRSRDYGHPLANHQRIADIWNGFLHGRLTSPIEPREVALMMIGMKLAREANSPKRDNLVDIVGYVKCVDMMDEVTKPVEKS